MLNVLTLSTLYPNRAQPNFGAFVERQTQRLAAHPDVNLKVIAPVGSFVLPVGPYAALRGIPGREVRDGVEVFFPSFPLIPIFGWRLNPRLVANVVRPTLLALSDEGFVPDVIDCEFFWPDGPAAAIIASELDIPLSIKARGSDINFWGGRGASRQMMLDASARAQGLLAVSTALKSDMVSMGMPSERIRVHRTGIELGQFVPSHDQQRIKAKYGVEGPLIFSAGNLVALKRHNLLIEAMVELPGITLLIAGEGRQRPKLEALIAEKGLGERVRLLGSIAHDAMPKLMAAADVYAHTASSEGLANVWVEALACGTPVVTTRVGGAEEVIDCSTAGTILDDPTPSRIADALRTAIANPPDRNAVRNSAMRFGWQENTNALYEHLAALKR